MFLIKSYYVLLLILIIVIPFKIICNGITCIKLEMLKTTIFTNGHLDPAVFNSRFSSLILKRHGYFCGAAPLGTCWSDVFFLLGYFCEMIWCSPLLFLCLAVSLWKDVTVNLKLKDIDAATEAKHRLEEKQRAEARERKEKEMQWETRVSVLMYMHIWRRNVPWEIMRLKYDSDKWCLIGSCCLLQHVLKLSVTHDAHSWMLIEPNSAWQFFKYIYFKRVSTFYQTKQLSNCTNFL